MKKNLVLIFLGCVLSLNAQNAVSQATVEGHNDNLTVEVKMSGDKIENVKVTKHKETKGIADKALKSIPEMIVKEQSLNIDGIAGSTVTSYAIIEGVKTALLQSGVDISKFTKGKSVASAPEVSETPFSKGWDATPALGIIKGDYYVEQQKFGRGEQHLGTLEVVVDSGKIVMVEFNEKGRPDYHTAAYQDQLKRLSEYNFMMGEIRGAAWIQGVLLAEKKIVEKQNLVADLDYVAGATETVVQGLEPLAKKINDKLSKGTKKRFYRVAEDLGGGITGVLDIVVEKGKIISCMYDEIFAASKEEIENPKLKKYYRTSKYESIMYKEDSRIGFRYQMNKLNERVVKTQDMFNIKGLPAAEKTADYSKNPSFDSYIVLAKKLHSELVKDGIIKK